MSNYRITPWTRDQANRLGVLIRPARDPAKKLDVYNKKTGEKIATIGSAQHMDYGQYLLKDKELANERRRLYKIRHQRDRTVKGSPGYWADQLLW